MAFPRHPDYDVNDPRLGLVHRIDKDTSGFACCGKDPRCKDSSWQAVFNKTTKREYVAMVWGIPDPLQGTVATNMAVRPRIDYR